MSLSNESETATSEKQFKHETLCLFSVFQFTKVKLRSKDTIIKDFYGLIRPYLSQTVAKSLDMLDFDHFVYLPVFDPYTVVV